MKFVKIVGVGLAVLASALLFGEASTQSLPEWNVILISWDGVQRAHLEELREQKALPNLEALAAAGAALPMEIRGHATDTKAGHSEMLSGYGPQITGIFSNMRYQAIPDSLTIFERLKIRFGQQIATVAITGKRQNIIEILENALPEIDFALIRTTNAARNGPIMLQTLATLKDRAFFAFLHFSDPDHVGHTYGENSKEYSEAIKTCDLWLGKIVAALRDLGILSKTLIYVTTDHGFDEGRKTHSNAPDIWLATNDPAVAPPEDSIALQGDVVPTLLERLGFELGALEPPLPGRSLVKKAVGASRP